MNADKQPRTTPSGTPPDGAAQDTSDSDLQAILTEQRQVLADGSRWLTETRRVLGLELRATRLAASHTVLYALLCFAALLVSLVAINAALYIGLSVGLGLHPGWAMAVPLLLDLVLLVWSAHRARHAISHIGLPATRQLLAGAPDATQGEQP